MDRSAHDRDRSAHVNDYPKCPTCNANLDGGDIFERLKANPEYANYSFSALIDASMSYGWSPLNKKRFVNFCWVCLDDKIKWIHR